MTRAARGGYSFEAPSRRNRGSRLTAPTDPKFAVSRSAASVDDAEARRAFRDILSWIGEDPNRDGLKNTPARMVRAYREYFAGYASDPEDALRTTFKEVDGYDEMIVLRSVTSRAIASTISRRSSAAPGSATFPTAASSAFRNWRGSSRSMRAGCKSRSG